VTPNAGGSIVIGCGATLTIEADVEVRFRADMGITVGHVGFGPGCLVARGTEASPILLTSNQPYEDPPFLAAPGEWGKVYLTDNASDAVYDDSTGEYISGSILEYVTVEYAGDTGSTVTIEFCSPYIAHCEIRHNASRGIEANVSNAPPIRIENCEIWDCSLSGGHGGGITLFGGTGHRLIGNFVHDCALTGGGSYRYGGGIYIETSCTLTDNVVTGNTSTHGGGIYANTTSCTLTDNDVTGNTSSHSGGGIYLYNCDSSEVIGNTITGNRRRWARGRRMRGLGGR
jgi:parallel beta-helix repeat protein